MLNSFFHKLKEFIVRYQLKLVYIVFTAILTLIFLGYLFIISTPKYSLTREMYYYDVVVYGGTPSGIMAAVAASQQGLKAAIVEPSAHLGGAITSGLCSSDTGNTNVFGGLAKLFFVKVGSYYQSIKPVYKFEPHAAEKIFTQIADSAGINVFYNQKLKEHDGVKKDGSKILYITTNDGCILSANVFIDSSYEGDLMADSAVSYTVGRENRDQYNESFAGVRPFVNHDNFKYNISAYTADGKLTPQISNEELAEVGQGDKKLPAYNYRLCLTDNPANQAPFHKPDNYDPNKYSLLLQWMHVIKTAEGNRDLKMTDVFSIQRLPNMKADVNSIGIIFKGCFISWRPIKEFQRSSKKTSTNGACARMNLLIMVIGRINCISEKPGAWSVISS